MSEIPEEPELVLSDEKLIALRRQIGEEAWADRLARARRREETVRRVEELLSQGQSMSAAVESLSLDQSIKTVRKWVRRYRARGLEGLIDRLGRLLLKVCAAGSTDTGSTRKPAVQKPSAEETCGADGSVRQIELRLDEPSDRKSRRGRKTLSFVKCAGSKRPVLGELLRRMPSVYGTYIEPMVGSGTVFVGLSPRRAVLSDVNAELMTSYEVVRDDPEALIRSLDRHVNTREHFLRVRATHPKKLSPVERAARFIYLNKTCFNGLYRVNRDGWFNVPFGNIRNANFKDTATIRRMSALLQGVVLICGDYAEVLKDAKRGDLVYLDPPYYLVEQQVFRYQPESFGESEHRRLGDVFRELDERGCLVMLSNSNTSLIHDIFRGYRIEVLKTRRPLNPDVKNRSSWEEVVITNFDASNHPPRHPKDEPGGDQLSFF